MKHILKCTCGVYTMKNLCPKCSKKTQSLKPPKYSPVDKYAKYQRETKLEQRKKDDLL